MGNSGTRWAKADLDGLGRARTPASPPGLASTRDGGVACVLQQGCRGFTGLTGSGRASVGLVCSCRSVRSTIVERRWRWVPPEWLWSYCPCFDNVAYLHLLGCMLVSTKRRWMVTTKPRWRVLVGGEAWWWCSVVSGFFVGRGQKKSMSACLTWTRCHHWWHHSFPKDVLKSSVYFTPSVGETLGPILKGYISTRQLFSYVTRSIVFCSRARDFNARPRMDDGARN
jgi:hypothetical protein